MDCQHLDDYYALCLLETLRGEACAVVREHMANHCAYCLAQLSEAARAVYLLCQPARTLRPDPKRKAQLLRRLYKK